MDHSESSSNPSYPPSRRPTEETVTSLNSESSDQHSKSGVLLKEDYSRRCEEPRNGSSSDDNRGGETRELGFPWHMQIHDSHDWHPENHKALNQEQAVDEGRFRCAEPDCRRSFAKKSDLKRHLEAVHWGHSWVCGCCENDGVPKYMSRKDKLKDHLVRYHNMISKKTEISCATCVRTLFSSDASHSIHSQKFHCDVQMQGQELSENGQEVCSPSSLGSSNITTGSDLSLKRFVEENGDSENKRLRLDVDGSEEQDTSQLAHYGDGAVIEDCNYVEQQQLQVVISNGTNEFGYPGSGQGEPFGLSDLDPEFLSRNLPYATSLNHVEYPKTYVIDIVSPVEQFIEYDMPRNNGWNLFSEKLISSETARDFIGGVSAIEFLALNAFKGKPTTLLVELRPDFDSVFNEVKQALLFHLKDAPVIKDNCILYDVENQQLTLTGKMSTLPGAINMVKRRLKDLATVFQSLIPGNSEDKRQQKHKLEDKRRQKSKLEDKRRHKSKLFRNLYDDTFPRSGQVLGSKKETDIHPFSRQNFLYEYETWTSHILPSIEEVLKELPGNNYAASLIGYGKSEGTADPCIQIDYPEYPAKAAEELIRKRIDQICVKNGRRQLPIRFSEGQYMELAGTCEDLRQPEDRLRYMYSYNKPEPNPSMGASVGMRCSYKVGGTLGGYLKIEDHIYSITAAHVVRDALDDRYCDENYPLGSVGRKELVSPALVDLDIIIDWLLKEIEDGSKAAPGELKRLSHRLNKKELSLSDMETELPRPLISLGEKLKLLRQCGNELPTIAVLGMHKKELRPSRMLKELHGIQTNTMMDWAVSKVTGQATSFQNRHRFKTAEDAWYAAQDHADRNSFGAGELCQGTCRPENNVRCYYVGRTSGHRECLVSDAVSAINYEGQKFKVMFVLDPKRPVKVVDDVEGDSGAWILRSTDNSVMGQLIGYDEGKLIFTPIQDVIDHLSEVFNGPVSIPKISSSGPTAPATEMRKISYINPRSERPKIPAGLEVESDSSDDESKLAKILYLRHLVSASTEPWNSLRVTQQQTTTPQLQFHSPRDSSSSETMTTSITFTESQSTASFPSPRIVEIDDTMDDLDQYREIEPVDIDDLKMDNHFKTYNPRSQQKLQETKLQECFRPFDAALPANKASDILAVPSTVPLAPKRKNEFRPFMRHAPSREEEVSLVSMFSGTAGINEACHTDDIQFPKGFVEWEQLPSKKTVLQ